MLCSNHFPAINYFGQILKKKHRKQRHDVLLFSISILFLGHAGNEPHMSVYSEINMENAMILSRRQGSVSKLQMQLAFTGRSQPAIRNGNCTGSTYLQTGKHEECRIK